MIPALLLAADLLDHAADSRYGDATNEMAAIRFEGVMHADESLRSLILGDFLTEADEGDFDVMSFSSWLWLLLWRQRQGATLDEQVLEGLTRRSTSVERRLRLRVLVGGDPTANAEVGSIDEYRFRHGPILPSPWLTNQVVEAAEGRTDPFELMRHLLQIGTDVTLAALYVLLRTNGGYRDALRREVRLGLEASQLDGATFNRWLDRLGLSDGDR